MIIIIKIYKSLNDYSYIIYKKLRNQNIIMIIFIINLLFKHLLHLIFIKHRILTYPKLQIHSKLVIQVFNK